MGRKFSDQAMTSNHTKSQGTREPAVFVVSNDAAYLKAVLSSCREIPDNYTPCSNIDQMMSALAAADKLNVVFAIIVEKDGYAVDTLLLRTCKLDYPQVNFIVMLEECEQRCYVRFQSLGVQSILLAPHTEVSLKNEITTALPNIPQFKRHPDLPFRGSVRFDFLVPSDLSYVLGINHLVSTLLKEFSFPAVDYRINIPLACDEAITNAMIHGNKSDAEKKVSVQIYISSSRIKLRIKDQGEGFDVEQVANPIASENLMRSSGRGVYLMRSIMDTVEYKDGGRVLELEKTNTNSNGNGAIRNGAPR